MSDFTRGSGPLSALARQPKTRFETDPMASYQSPTLAAEAAEAEPEDSGTAGLYRKARETLMASQSTGMDPLTTFLLAASQAGPGGIGAAIGRGGIAAQQAMVEGEKSEQERQLKLLTLGIEEGKYKDTLVQRKAEKEADLAFRSEEAEKERQAKIDAAKIAAESRVEAAQQAAQARLDLAALAAGNKSVPVSTQKKIFDLTDKATGFEQDANKYENLADQFEKEKPTAGFFGNIEKKSKQIFGTEDYETYLRTEWQTIQRQQMLQNLPKGAASDADVRMVREAQPGDFANPKLVASLLRGMAKIKRWNSQLANFQSDFVSSNPTKSTSLEDMEIGGIMIPKGTTYSGAVKLFNEKTPLELIFNVSEKSADAKSTSIDFGEPPPGAVRRK